MTKEQMLKREPQIMVSKCEWAECGKVFEYDLIKTNFRRKKFCCEECYKKAKYANTLAKKKERREQKEDKKEGKVTKHDSVLSTPEISRNYAEYQRRQTLEALGKINASGGQ